MDYFIIEKNTAGRVKLFMEDEEIIVGQKYPLEKEQFFNVVKQVGFIGVPLDEFTYSMEINGIKSQNLAVIKLNYPADGTTPEQVTLTPEIVLNEEVIFSDLVPADNSFDRIIINEVSGKGRWLIDNRDIVAGETIMYYQLADNLKFVASDTGGSATYNTMKFQFATHEKVHTDENEIVFSLLSEAGIDSPDMYIETEEESGVVTKRFFFELSNQIVGTDFEISAEVNIAKLEDDAENFVKFEFNEAVETITTNDMHILSGTNDNSNGQLIFMVTVRVMDGFEPGDKIEFTLTEIDGGTDYIDDDKNTLTFNF